MAQSPSGLSIQQPSEMSMICAKRLSKGKTSDAILGSSRAKRTTSSRASSASPFPLQQNEPHDGQSYFSARSGKVKKLSKLLLGGSRRSSVHRRRRGSLRRLDRHVDHRRAA